METDTEEFDLYSDDYMTADEIKCANCGTILKIEDSVTCVCHKYGYSGHEDTGWCSQDCMMADHPDA